MKLNNMVIIFIIIILPFSVVSRNNMRDYFMTLKDQVRLNNVIDIATQDALESLVELNDEFQMLYINQRFDVTQALAQEAVNSFFRTLATNFNMPFNEEYVEAYFSVYVPAIVIVGYDGFFIYSVDENPTGGYSYHMSPKIPYAYEDEKTKAIINFTLGNYIKIYTNGRFYEGELTDDYIEDSDEKYEEYVLAFGDEDTAFNSIADLTNDMSILIAALHRKERKTIDTYVPDFLIASRDAEDVALTKDFTNTDDSDGSDFHFIRRTVIINLIQDTLRQEINSHQTYAQIMGSTYNFRLPDIPSSDWTNSINDISVLSFIQGMPIGVNSYYNNYALGGSRIIETDYIYGTSDKIYHSSHCETIQAWFENPDDSVDNIFVNRVEAARQGYWPCLKCNP